jgi:dihydrofolate synthase/folylpolyglutamate synthase
VDVLGSSVDAIAREKAAIARRGVPMFSASRADSEAGRAVEEVCARAGAPLFVQDLDFGVVKAEPDGGGLRVDVKTRSRARSALRLPTPARYQAENLALAVAVLDSLAERGLVAGAESALAPEHTGDDFRVPGRFEIVRGAPPIVLDGAHTLESLEALFASIDGAFPAGRRIAVAGASRDKDLARLSSAFRGRVDLVLATQAPTPRAVEPAELAAALRAAGVEVRAAATPEEALTSAVAEAGRSGLVVVTGSLYLVAAVKTTLLTFEQLS